ncbi:DMT family transporter [Pseudooceanicola sp. LIPI14-2-Ac024]|uniref:DMT family transporter n=1 Tax=Pseudooceanicola sp. LIPI14-2-Ac024 TaxID=3344875 RepID=UPI0035CF4970
MQGAFPFLALSVLAGALVAAQGPIYARMAHSLGGPLQAVLTAFTSAACVLALLALAGGFAPRVDALRAMPVWVWLGGMLGIAVVAISTLAVPRLGAAGYLVALVAGQMVAAALYDRAGAFGLPQRVPSALNLLGLALVVIGALLVTWRR